MTMFNQIVPKFGRQCRPLCPRFGRGLCTKGNKDKPVRAPWKRHDPWGERGLSPTEIAFGPFWWRRGRGPFEEPEDISGTLLRRLLEKPEAMSGTLLRRLLENYGTPSHFAESGARTEVDQVRYNGKVFEVKIDVQKFSPEDLDVKLVGSNLTITGQHERKQDDHGYVSRRFSREFLVPEGVDLETFESSVSADGIMTVRANVKGAEKAEEKKIKIKFEKAD